LINIFSFAKIRDLQAILVDAAKIKGEVRLRNYSGSD